MTTPQETEKYFNKVILHLANPENVNTEVGLDDLFSFLEIPEDYNTPVYNSLWYGQYIDGKAALKNPKIKINRKGVEMANTLRT